MVNIGLREMMVIVPDLICKALFSKKKNKKQPEVTHTCSLSPQAVKSGGSGAQGLNELQETLPQNSN